MALSNADFELLLQANRVLSSKLDSTEVLNTVLELAKEVVKAEAASLLLHDPQKNELYFDVALGSVKESVKQIRLKVGEGLAGWVAKEKKSIVVNDVSQDPRFTARVDKSTSFVTHSVLAVPLLVKGQMIGVVEAINKKNKGLFTEQDQEIFEIFGSQAGIAIENARLFSEVVREKEKLAAVFIQMSDGIFLLNKDGQVIMMNEAGSSFVGLKPDDVKGNDFGPSLFPDFQITPPLENLAAFQSKITPIEMVRKKGKEFYATGIVLRVRSADQSTNEGYFVILHDTTEEKRGERLKRNFLSLISHKLKTPLTVIIGYAPSLLDQSENLTSFQKTAIKAISEKGEQLGSLVDKLLRFTMAESDSLRCEPQPISLLPILQEALSSLESDRIEKGTKLTVDPALDKNTTIYADAALVLEVLKNIIENGIKFNDKKEQTLSISVFGKPDELILKISDNGCGIPAEEMDKIFQKFYQVENSFTGQVPGAGLGLALCKRIMEILKGKITIESQLGEGTTVLLSFPISISKK